jgi:phosphoribosyl-ATP pyrophosphohydrolase
MKALYEEYKIILERKQNQAEEKEAEGADGEKSYTKYLFKQGINKILKKVGEESAELIIAAKDASNASVGSGGEASKALEDLVVEESADLFYHVLIMLAELGIPLSDVEAELEKRARKAGNLKDLKTVDKNT